MCHMASVPPSPHQFQLGVCHLIASGTAKDLASAGHQDSTLVAMDVLGSNVKGGIGSI